MLRCGFFDSVDGDRKYNARDISKLFDGIILDGIFAAVGDHFSINVHSAKAMTVTVGTGQAWLNHVKIINTSPLQLTFDTGSSNRYDAIVVEVNELKRDASIFIKKDAGKSPSNITIDTQPIDMSKFTNNEYIHQYLLGYVFIRAGQNKILTDDVASKIGFDSPEGIPYVTGPLETLPADETLKQWVAQWTSFYNASSAYLNSFKVDSADALADFQIDSAAEINAFKTKSTNEINTFKTNSTSEINTFKTNSTAEINTFKSNGTTAISTFITNSTKLVQDWIESEETDWNTWFDGKKDAWDELWEYVTEELNTVNIAETYATKEELGDAVTEVKDYTDTKVGTKANIASPTFTGTPKAPTPATNTNNTQIATTAFVKAVVNALINGAPETLDTLKEIADAIEANETIVEALNTAIGTKANTADVLPLNGSKPMTGVLNPDQGISYAGITNYIAYPDDGFLLDRSGNKTGYVRITLPRSWSSTMIAFTVSFYHYRPNESVDYRISGYNNITDAIWKNCTVYCIGKAEEYYSNLKVKFGHDGEKCAIEIGEIDTVYQYPIIKVHDILTGYNSYYYPLWKTGWKVEVTTEELPIINVTIDNTHITYGCTAKKAIQDSDGNVFKDTYLPINNFDDLAAISCLGEKAFTLWANGKQANILDGFEILNWGMIVENNFWKTNGPITGQNNKYNGGFYIRNTTGYPVKFYVLRKYILDESYNGYIQYGRGNNNGSLPTYMTTGANRLAYTNTNNLNTDWKLFSYVVNNNETFFFGCASSYIKWIGADINYASKLEEVFQSVSDGKELIASAITDKGVTTASDATFQTMANNIGAIAGAQTPIAWSNTSNGSYKFVQYGHTWISNSRGVASSTATSTWTVNLTKATQYTFHYGVNSESSHDKLTITVNGTKIADAISGEKKLSATVTLNAGTNTIVATYTKDSAIGVQNDCGYIVLSDVYGTTIKTQYKVASTPGTTAQVIKPDSGYDGIASVYIPAAGATGLSTTASSTKQTYSDGMTLSVGFYLIMSSASRLNSTSTFYIDFIYGTSSNVNNIVDYNVDGAYSTSTKRTAVIYVKSATTLTIKTSDNLTPESGDQFSSPVGMPDAVVYKMS